MSGVCVVRAEALVVPAGACVGGAAVEPVGVPRVPGFVESSFSPLVKAVVDRCLAAVTGGGAFAGDEGAGTGLVLVSAFGDTVTADLGSRLLVSGQVQNPLLFYQSVPTTILGVVARDYGITGPTTCVSACGDLCAGAFGLVEAMLGDGVSQVVVVGVDLAAAERPRAAAAGGAPHADTAVALLVRCGDGTGDAVTVAGGRLPEFGGLSGLVQVYCAVRARRAAGSLGPIVVDLGGVR